MRSFTTTVDSLINQDTVDFFILIKLSFNTTYYLSTLSEDVTFDSNTYKAHSGIFEYSSPKFSSVVDREAYTISIIDTDYGGQSLYSLIKTEIESNIVGKGIQVMVGFFDSNNQPLLQPANVLTIYKGFVDSPAIKNDWENRVIGIEGTSPMSDLDIVVPFAASKDGAAQRDTADRAFDKIYTDNLVKLKWGKI